MAHATFEVGDLTAVIGDNEAHGEHRAGYNGLWSLRHRACPRSLFVPAYAGLNLEHIFDGEQEFAPGAFFEPRTAPMTFRQPGDDAAELYQPPTPIHHLESWTRFHLQPPHYLDVTFRFVPHRASFRHGYVGLFWASYMDGPEDKSLYFLGGPERQEARWTQLCTQTHNDESSVRHRDDALELAFAPEAHEALFRSLSPLRYELPFYYGRFEGLTWIVMFERAEGVRFVHSPSGGGANAALRTACPAWDFLYVLPQYEVGREYALRWRACLRPACSREEVLAEYERWRDGL